MTLEEFTSEVDKIVNEVPEERRADMQVIAAGVVAGFREENDSRVKSDNDLLSMTEERDVAIAERDAANVKYGEATQKYYEVLRNYGGVPQTKPEPKPEYKETGFDDIFEEVK